MLIPNKLTRWPPHSPQRNDFLHLKLLPHHIVQPQAPVPWDLGLPRPTTHPVWWQWFLCHVHPPKPPGLRKRPGLKLAEQCMLWIGCACPEFWCQQTKNVASKTDFVWRQGVEFWSTSCWFSLQFVYSFDFCLIRAQATHQSPPYDLFVEKQLFN